EDDTGHLLQAELERGLAAAIAVDHAIATVAGLHHAERLEQPMLGDRRGQAIDVARIVAHPLRVGLQRPRVEVEQFHRVLQVTVQRMNRLETDNAESPLDFGTLVRDKSIAEELGEGKREYY